MSASGINYIYTKLGIRSGAFKIYYDFSSLDGDSLPSISGGYSGFSGAVQGGMVVDNGSGLFDRTSWVEPQNINNSFDINNWSMFFNYEKEDSEECIMFNSLETGAVSSGFRLGINDANKFYFHFYGSGEPFYYTSNNVIGSKNTICVAKSPNSIEFNYFDFNNKKFETESYITNDKFLFYSDQFKLFQDFSGYSDGFIYLNGNVSYSNRQRLCSGFFLDPTFITGRIGVSGYEKYSTGHIAGNNKVYETGLKTFTGNLNYSNDTITITNSQNLKPFGYITDNCDINDNLYVYDGIYTGKADADILFPLTGHLELQSHISGGYVEPISISGIQVTGYEEYDYPIYTGMTGIIRDQYIAFIDECGRPVFAYEDIFLTGVLSGQNINPLTGYVTVNLGSGLNFSKEGAFQILDLDSSRPFQANADLIYTYGMEFISYTEEEDIEDFQEIVIFPEQRGLTLYNKTPFYDPINTNFILDQSYSTGAVNLFLNGVLQYQSGYNISGDIFNVIYRPQADYFLSGANVKSNSFYDTNDLVIYDAPIPSQKKIASFDDQTSFATSGLFTDFRIFEDDLIFLNGQKRYSGLNYQISGGEWMEPISGFDDITGVIMTAKKYVGERSLTGSYTKFTPTKFPRTTSVFFLNGVRIPRDQYIEHSSIDLISGNNISLKGKESLYNNDSILGFWENGN